MKNEKKKHINEKKPSENWPEFSSIAGNEF